RMSKSVRQCILALQEAPDTTHKFAALMLVTKIIRAESLDERVKLKLFDAIGTEFLASLVREDVGPDGSLDPIFKSIALSILSFFVTTGQRRSFFTSLIPELLDIVSESELHGDNLALVQDAFQCLDGIVAHKPGRKALINHDGLDVLVDVYKLENFCQGHTMKTLMLIMAEEGPNTWLQHPNSFMKLVTHVSQEFVSNHCERKFELCSVLVELLHSMNGTEQVDGGYDWQKQVHRGLCDIILSKLGREQRYQGLHLAAAALDELGPTWVIAGGPKGQHLMLAMVHLACVEVRMSLEGESFEKTVELAPQTTSFYLILENAIKFLVNGAMELEEKQKQQLYAALKGAFHAVLSFLESVTEEKVHTSSSSTQMFVCATIRVLGAWLAEETTANKSEVYSVLPLVVSLSKYNFYFNKDTSKSTRKKKKISESLETELPDLLRFLLPGLCHLTAEDEPRSILLNLGIEQLLLDYLTTKYETIRALFASPKEDGNSALSSSSDKFEVCDTLVTLCSILMNIVVTCPREVQSNDLYYKLLKFIFSIVTEIPLERCYLKFCGNLCVLGLMILRHHFVRVKHTDFAIYKFIQSTVRFLWDAHNVEESLDYATLVVSQKYRILWDELMELWHLGMHNLMMLLAPIPWLCDFLLECEWPQTIIQTLAQVKIDGVEAGFKTVIEDMLCMMVRCSEPAKRTLKQAEAVRVAKLHEMESLVL
ncbi:Neurochondrin, partial [Trinorchestia longiramus]